MKRLLPLTVAAALLLVPGPVSAAGLDRDGGFWGRLDPGAFFAQVWGAFLDVLPMGGGSIDPNGGDGGDNDGGGSIDPNGLTVGEGGGSIDPNGRD